MPEVSNLVTVTQMRGTPQFRAALAEFAAQVGAASLCEVYDLGLELLARKHKVALPPRANVWGSNGRNVRKRRKP